jgi:hypothetical protein
MTDRNGRLKPLHEHLVFAAKRIGARFKLAKIEHLVGILTGGAVASSRAFL